VRAKKAVVSNASMWDTLGLLPEDIIPKSYSDRVKRTPQCESFMHLHLGFDAEVSIAIFLGTVFSVPLGLSAL